VTGPSERGQGRGRHSAGEPSGSSLLTVGHGTASQVQLTELLRGAEVELVVDVRTAPGSRRHPHVARAQLERWLPAAGVAYRWSPDLGGFRKPPPDSPDVAWREPMFRGYAAWMREAPFRAALGRVLGAAAERRTAVMCSEAVWWRCHRRLVADAVVLLHQVPVRHLMHDGRLAPHSPSPAARVVGGLLVYDAGALPG
jgi:uncharacterized protein (DUF488 family)